MRTFKTVATTLNFHRAAELLHYAQSTISSQIRGLEEDFGIPLFDRLGKHIRLTMAGETLLRYAERLLDLEQETLSEMSEIHVSQAMIALRTPQTLCENYLPEIISRFQRSHPTVGLDISTCAFHNLQRELKSGVIDLAFLYAEDLPAPELICENLGAEAIILAVNREHELARYSDFQPADLKNQTLMLPKHDCAYKMELEQVLAQEKIHPVTMMTFNSVTAIKACLLKGIGVGLLPERMVATELADGRLKSLPVPIEVSQVPIRMLRHRNKWLSPTVKAFIHETRTFFRSLSGDLEDLQHNKEALLQKSAD